MKFPQGVAAYGITPSSSSTPAAKPQAQSVDPPASPELSGDDASRVVLKKDRQEAARAYAYTKDLTAPQVAPRPIVQPPPQPFPQPATTAQPKVPPQPKPQVAQVPPRPVPSSTRRITEDLDDTPPIKEVDPELRALAMRYVDNYAKQIGQTLTPEERTTRITEIESFYGVPSRAGRLEAIVKAQETTE